MKGRQDDCLQIDPEGSPEEEAALHHDFALCIAVQTHDFMGELAANNDFAQRMNKAGNMRSAQFQFFQAQQDYAAAKFIGYGANGAALDGAFRDQVRWVVFGRPQS